MNTDAIRLVKQGTERRKLLPCALVIIALGLGPIACSTAHRADTGAVHAAHPGHAALGLNAGEKWLVPEPMMVHMRNLEKDVQDFERTPGQDNAALASQIQDNLGRFVTSCTMEGKAHDQLHKWLMPMLGVSAEYAQATDPRVQQEQLKKIKESLQVFHEYFE